MRKWGEFSEEQQEALAVTQQKKLSLWREQLCDKVE